MNTEKRSMKENSKKFTYSKLLIALTGFIFLSCVLFVVYLYLSDKIANTYDTTAIVTLITVSGAIFGSNLCWYSKKAASENHYKLRMSLYEDSSKVRLKYNEHMMDLMKKYKLTQADIDRINETGDMDEMMSAALDNAVTELDTQQNDADSTNNIENFNL